MASIDKIYGTKAQYKKFFKWTKINHPAWLRYFYPLPLRKMKRDERFAMTNFPVDVDRYLLNNCPLDFVIAELREQYRINS